MQNVQPGCPPLKTVVASVLGILLFACLSAPPALAQHAGGHVGGGHVGAPASHPSVARPVSPIVSPPNRGFIVRPPLIRPPASGVIIGYPYRPPIRPRRPVFPIYPAPIVPPLGFGLFGLPFFGYGFAPAWGFWGGCDPLWNWGYDCNALPLYDNGVGMNAYSAPPYAPPPVQYPNWPVYYGDEYSQYVELFLKDGTVYTVTDYWLVNGDLHFKCIENNGTQVVEHTLDFNQLDLQRTIDVNTARGFRFVLRDEPLEQYLKDHPSPADPYVGPAEPGPIQPPPQPAPETQPPAD